MDLEGRSGSINIMAAAEGYWSRVFIRSWTTLLLLILLPLFAYLAAGNGRNKPSLHAHGNYREDASRGMQMQGA